MEVHFSPDKEAQAAAVRRPHWQAQVFGEAVDRTLEYEVRFLEAVEEGRAAARRGELLEHDAVVEDIEQILRS